MHAVVFLHMFAAASCFHIIANDSTRNIKGEKTALVGPSAKCMQVCKGSEEFVRGHRTIWVLDCFGEYSFRFT